MYVIHTILLSSQVVFITVYVQLVLYNINHSLLKNLGIAMEIGTGQ